MDAILVEAHIIEHCRYKSLYLCRSKGVQLLSAHYYSYMDLSTSLFKFVSANPVVSICIKATWVTNGKL